MDAGAGSSWIPATHRPIILIGMGVWGWALNLFILTKKHIDPVFLLQMHQGDKRHAPYKSIFVLAGSLTGLIFVNQWYYMLTVGAKERSWLPLLCYLSALCLLLWPGQGLCRPERMRFIRTLKRIAAPSLDASVYFGDIILADILTSFSNVFGDLATMGRVILAGQERALLDKAQAKGDFTLIHDLVVPLCVSLPYLIRFRQCLSEYINSRGKSKRHLFNAAKYASAFPVIVISALHKKASWHMSQAGSVPSSWWMGEATLFRLWFLFVCINSMYSFWWDISMDWNVVQLSTGGRTARGYSSLTPSIRTHFHFSPQSYFLAVLIDFALRITWSLKLSSHVFFKRMEGDVFLLGFLEIFRRWIWVFFRMESEWMKRSHISLPNTSREAMALDVIDRPQAKLEPIREEDDGLLS